MEFNKLMKDIETYQQGMDTGREMAIHKYDKILIELWEKINDVEKKIDKLFTYIQAGAKK